MSLSCHKIRITKKNMNKKKDQRPETSCHSPATSSQKSVPHCISSHLRCRKKEKRKRIRKRKRFACFSLSLSFSPPLPPSPIAAPCLSLCPPPPPPPPVPWRVLGHCPFSKILKSQCPSIVLYGATHIQALYRGLFPLI